jgi:hypothetical protein
MRNFMGKDFVWFVGVVEDRSDPLQMGRVRVRCFGWHTDDKIKIPTNMLPWAIPINGIQSASVSGLGYSPTGIVPGSWVVGFFMDGERAQEPVIFGTIPGMPSAEPDPNKGFNDPRGIYPINIGMPDTNFAARETTCEDHANRAEKNANRFSDDERQIRYPVAVPPKITTVVPDAASSYYAMEHWAEIPAAEDKLSEYPKNHVYETESGHLQEFDDTEGNRRYHRYHPAGTYEEIYDDGTRQVKIVGDDYEIVIGKKNIYVKGDWNVTVEGTKRELIKGNYHLQVEGETTFDLQQSFHKKIGMTEASEIGRDLAVNIGGNHIQTVTKGDQILNVTCGQKIETIQRDYTLMVNEDFAMTTMGNTQIFSTGDYKLMNLGAHYVTSKGTMTIETPANQNITVQGNVSETISGNQTTAVTGTKTETAATGNVTYTAGDVQAAGISLVSHTHGGVESGSSSTGAPE